MLMISMLGVESGELWLQGWVARVSSKEMVGFGLSPECWGGFA